MNNILFLCCAYSESQVKLFQNSSIRGFQFAAQNFQASLIDGFLQDKEVKLTVASIPSLSTYPKGCKIKKVRDSPFLFNGQKVGQSFGYLNFPFLNHISQSRIDKYIDKWYKDTEGEKCIVVYALLRQQMTYAVSAKKRHHEIKLCLVIPDLPIYMNCNKYYKMLGLQKRDRKSIDTLLHIFDSYVVLAEPMVSQLMITEKPYTVIEGIYSVSQTNLDNVEKFPNRTILYAGGIQTRYGVFDLIEAFHLCKNKDFRLVLCGPCLEMEKLNQCLTSDSRIEYRGILPTEEVHLLQRQSTLLVNPRHSTEEFTKYSFPSKTIEYMASGTPVLMSPLPSMPNEYNEYLFLFEDETIAGMSAMLDYILSLKEQELNQKGRMAREFIVNNKNSKEQVHKIVQLIEKISE